MRTQSIARCCKNNGFCDVDCNAAFLPYPLKIMDWPYSALTSAGDKILEKIGLPRELFVMTNAMSSLLTVEEVFFQPATENTCAAGANFGEVERSAPAGLIQILFLTFPLASITQCAAVAITFSSINIPEQ